MCADSISMKYPKQANPQAERRFVVAAAEERLGMTASFWGYAVLWNCWWWSHKIVNLLNVIELSSLNQAKNKYPV
jgi:hypothetical protein